MFFLKKQNIVKYYDSVYEYKHIILTKDKYKEITKNELLNNSIWMKLGIKQTKGWVHYSIYHKEPHILLLKRPIGINPQTGLCSKDIMEKVEKHEKIKNNLS